ncbi:MAG: D-alanine--poly(phosphoribitol) ligase subunit DltA [Raoultibacter sp.]
MARSRYLDAIEKAYLETPDNIAYRRWDNACLTYRDLWESSDALAVTIHDYLQGKPQPVVVYGGKDPLVPLCFLACLKAGCAYVPIDEGTPLSRFRSIFEQLSAPLVLATEKLPEQMLAGAGRVVDAAQLGLSVQESLGRCEALQPVAGEDVEYIIFTSGSTGLPKGVQVTANCVDNFMDWAVGLLGVQDAPKIIVNQAHFCFDLSVYELTGAFSTGSTLFALDARAEADFGQMFEALRSSGAHVWVSTPSFADLCLADPAFSASLMPDMETLVFCGEVLRNSTAAKLHDRFPRARIINTYGPTESTVAVTAIEVTEDLIASEEGLPVGYARPGTVISIVDHETRVPVARGASGEILIVGNTVARGYVGLPQRTAQSFSSLQLAGGEWVRAYYTGDRGYLDDDGLLHCQGRFDHQIKLNGFRIELGEVEAQLNLLPYVDNAVVVVVQRRGKNSHLVAHVVLDRLLAENDFETTQIIRHDLAQRLPSYMLPKKVVVVTELPLTTNGKIDRKALCVS